MDEVADAPKGEAPYKAEITKFHCVACGVSHRLRPGELKFTGKNAVFTGLYALSDRDHVPQRIYFCEINHVAQNKQTDQIDEVGSAISAARVHFNRCRYKDVIVEQDTEGGFNHYVSCLEPTFKCDRCRRDLPTQHWFCADLDASPTISWEDVYNSQWFLDLGREVIPEQIVMNPEACRKWIEKRVLPKF